MVCGGGKKGRVIAIACKIYRFSLRYRMIPKISLFAGKNLYFSVINRNKPSIARTDDRNNEVFLYIHLQNASDGQHPLPVKPPSFYLGLAGLYRQLPVDEPWLIQILLHNPDIGQTPKRA
jgi:hypothetical protein